MQASVNWLTVYVPYATGLMLTLSRGSMGGGNSQCDWDNFFASMMQGSDKRGRDLGFFNLTNTVPSLIMPWLTLAMVPVFGFSGLFWVLAGLAALATLLLATRLRGENAA